MSTTRPPAYDQATGSAEASRRGAHRARARPALAGLPILAGILIVVLAVGGAWYVLGGTTKDSSTVQGAVPDDEDTAGSVPASAGASAGASAAATTQAAATTPVADPTQDTTQNSAQVDKTIGIRVLNSVPVQGLASRVSTDLTASGWKVSSKGNSKQKNLPTSKVYYGDAASKATAQAVVKDLGYGIIDLEPTVATDGLILVLGQDAE